MMNTTMNTDVFRGLAQEWKVAEPKRALITGGSRGIGRETAAMLTGRGWVVDAPKRAKFDVNRRGSLIRQLVSRMEWPMEGSLDALILCAGEWGVAYHGSKQWIDEFDNQWWYFNGHIRLLEHCLPALRAASGCVVAVASTRAFIGGVDSAPYSVAKAALVCLMQGFAREYDGDVRFNVVCPGLTATAMEAAIRASGGAKRDTVAQSAESVASVIVSLIESGANGRVVRVVNDRAATMTWAEENQ